MKNINYILISILILVVLLAGYNQISQEQKSDKLNVVVSILPQKAFVEAVGGNLVSAKELIPQGGSPATYEPNPSDLALVEKANIYFKVGHIPFEKSHIDKLAGLNPDMKIVDTSVNVQLIYFENGGIDPHVWLSPMQVKMQIDVIAQTLSQEDPTNADTFKRNAENFKNQLDKLHSEIDSQLNELKTDKLLVFHPAWGYFADEYGLKQIAIEQSGKEPTAQELQHIIEEAKKEDIKVIFIQSQFNKEIAKSIAEEVGAVVVSIDPLSEDYIDNLRNVAIKISSNLK